MFAPSRVLGLIGLVMWVPLAEYAVALDWQSVPLATEQDLIAGRTGGEGFQMVQSIVFAPSDANIMYLATDTSQVWRSDDAGKFWRPARGGFAPHGAASLLVSPTNPETLFAAATYGATRAKAKDFPNRLEGVYRSFDGGNTWTLVRKTGFFKTKNKGRLLEFVTDATNGRTPALVAGSADEGLLLSTDLGDSWIVLEAGLQDITDLARDPAMPGAFYVAAKQGLLHFHGGKFRRLGVNLTARPLSIATSLDGSNRLWITAQKSGVFRSMDGGRIFSSSGGDSAVVLRSSPVDSNLLFAKSDRAGRARSPIVSRDGGLSWISGRITERLDNRFDREQSQFWFSAPFAPHPKNANIVFSASNGKGRVLRSPDAGKTWEYSGSGFTGGRAKDMAFLPDGRILMAFTDHGIWLSNGGDDGPYEYVPTPRVHGARSCSAVAARGDLIIAALGSWEKKSIAVSKDFGHSWRVIANTAGTHGSIHFDPTDDRYVYTESFISSDSGQTWQRSDQRIMAVTEDGSVFALSKSQNETTFLESHDHGASWRTIAASLPIQMEKVHDAAITTIGEKKVYLATSNGIYLFANDIWKRIDENHGLAKDHYGRLFVSEVEIDPNNQAIVYAGRRSPGWGQSNGVFRSTDGGASWHNINATFGMYLTVWSLQIRPRTGDVFIGTSLGTYRLVPDEANPVAELPSPSSD